MNFLAAVCTKIIESLGRKIWAVVSAAVFVYMRRKKIDEESKESVDPLKKAKTGEEIDKASDDALSGF